jgi:UDP-GlcNAc:undecaprenyl-phosphate GlcNAc-1-phosphate transferase
VIALRYAFVGAIACVVTFLATFVVRKYAPRWGLIAQPTDRSVHRRATPTAGGIAMFAGFLVALIVASQLSAFNAVFEGSSEVLGVVLAATIIFGVGLIDDLFEVSAPAKIAGQVFAATVLYFLGVTMFYFRIPFAGFVVLSPDLAPLFTVAWVLLIANAINLIDGLDGLAAGIVAIASGAFFIYGDRLEARGLLEPGNIGPLIAVITAGICLGFLPHNFNPARIFMGDTGALLLGVLMAASTMVVGGRSDEGVSGQTFFFFAPAVIPLVILGVPVLDTAFAFVRRTLGRQGFANADKKHLHHRLMELGHGPRRSVVILWIWTALLSGFVLVPFLFDDRAAQLNAVAPFGVASMGVALYTVLHPGARRNKAISSHPSSWRAESGDHDDHPAGAARIKRPRPTVVDIRDRASVRPPITDGGDETTE